MALVRVSVANLATDLVSLGSGINYRIAFLSPGAYRKKIKRFQALGGASQLTLLGVEVIREKFNAREFERDETTGFTDARFVVNELDFEAVFRRFELLAGTTNSFEHDPGDDIRHELCDSELPGIPPALTPEDIATVKVIYQKTVRQPVPETGTGTSLRERPDMPTRRLFRIYTLYAPEAVVKKIVQSPAVRVLTLEELATTVGGSRKGHTYDGIELADNLFI